MKLIQKKILGNMSDYNTWKFVDMCNTHGRKIRLLRKPKSQTHCVVVTDSVGDTVYMCANFAIAENKFIELTKTK